MVLMASLGEVRGHHWVRSRVWSGGINGCDPVEATDVIWRGTVGVVKWKH